MINILLRKILLIPIIYFSTCELSEAKNIFPAEIRIGLFNLFHPKLLSFTAINSLCFINNNNSEEIKTISSKQIYEVTIQTKQVVITSNGNIIAQGEKVFIKPSNLSANKIEFKVTGKHGSIKRLVTGSLEFYAKDKDNELQTVLTQNVEDVVAIVTASEMSGVLLREALKCQSIVVRSFLFTHLGRHKEDGYDLCDNTHCQLYFGEPQDSLRSFQEATKATQETMGKILWNKGSPLEVYFTACCGGRTTTTEVAWGKFLTRKNLNDDLNSVKCSWCKGTKFYRWQRSIERELLVRTIASNCQLQPSQSTSLKILQKSNLGFVTQIEISDKNKKYILSNIQFRSYVGKQLGWNLILSNFYSIEIRNNKYIFHGSGFGHQVGLCVEGTIAQAKNNRTCEQILNFYFPNTTVKKFQT